MFTHGRPRVFASIASLLSGVAAALPAALVLAGGLAGAQIPPGGVEKEVKLDGFTPGLAGLLEEADHFGRSVATVRDLDHDGHGDIVVGAPWDGDGGPNRGAVWILFLDAEAKIKHLQKISSTQGGFTGTLDDFSYFGATVTYLGDLNNDGSGDIAVASLGDDTEAANAGAVWVIFLKPDGTVLANQKITVHLDPNDIFGRSLAGLPDVDGDGVLDLAVSASADDDAGVNAGAVYIIYLTHNGTLKHATKITEGLSGFTGDLHDDDRFGQAVASIGDLDGDGVPDLAVGAWRDDTGAADQGALWVLLMGPDGQVKTHVKLAEGLGGFDGHLDTADQFGGSVTSVGDVNGDSITDLAVGAYFDDDGAPNAGAVWILFMNEDGTAKGSQKISNVAGNFGGTIDSGDRFAAVSAIEDLDDDGTVELGVGAVGDDSMGPFTGAAWVLYLHASEWIDLGFGLAGSLGVPKLAGNGTLEPKTEVMLTITNGTPNAPVMLVIGASVLQAPFAGGVLVPKPDAIHLPGPTGGGGFIAITGRWPADAPPGSQLWFQAWMPDVTSVRGYSASNALQAVSP